MRVVVTGAAGFVGSHLAEQLLALGHDVVGIDAFIPYYPRPIKEANLAVALQNPRFRFFEVDLRSDPVGEAFSGADAVIHEAAMPGLPQSWTNFDAYLTCNVQATQRLLEACRAAKVGRLVYASTSSVYGLDATGSEDDPPKPVSPYGVTKLAAEELCRAYGRSFGLDVVYCRYFSIFGPRQRPDMAYHIFSRSLLEGKPITVFGDGQQSRGNTYVLDIVDGTIRALERGRTGQVYNLGGGTEIALIDAIRILERVTERAATLDFRPNRVGDQRRTLADTGRARVELGWEPRVSIEAGLRAEVVWVRQALAVGLLEQVP
jgi:nucleoside-diphosphate-sugar epimerase